MDDNELRDVLRTVGMASFVRCFAVHRAFAAGCLSSGEYAGALRALGYPSSWRRRAREIFVARREGDALELVGTAAKVPQDVKDDARRRLDRL